MAFKLINLWQTSDERRAKYWLARSLGLSSYWAMTVRDWRLAKIERMFNLDLVDGPEIAAQFRLVNFARVENGSRFLLLKGTSQD